MPTIAPGTSDCLRLRLPSIFIVLALSRSSLRVLARSVAFGHSRKHARQLVDVSALDRATSDEARSSADCLATR